MAIVECSCASITVRFRFWPQDDGWFAAAAVVIEHGALQSVALGFGSDSSVNEWWTWRTVSYHSYENGHPALIVCKGKPVSSNAARDRWSVSYDSQVDSIT